MWVEENQVTIEKSEDSGSSCSASSKDSFAKWLVSGLVSTPPFLLSLFFKFFRQALHFISSLYLISFDMIDYFFLQTHCFVGFCETPFPLSFYYSNCTFSLYFHFAYWSSLEELCTSILAFSLSRLSLSLCISHPLLFLLTFHRLSHPLWAFDTIAVLIMLLLSHLFQVQVV